MRSIAIGLYLFVQSVINPSAHLPIESVTIPNDSFDETAPASVAATTSTAVTGSSSTSKIESDNLVKKIQEPRDKVSIPTSAVNAKITPSSPYREYTNNKYNFSFLADSSKYVFFDPTTEVPEYRKEQEGVYVQAIIKIAAENGETLSSEEIEDLRNDYKEIIADISTTFAEGDQSDNREFHNSDDYYDYFAYQIFSLDDPLRSSNGIHFISQEFVNNTNPDGSWKTPAHYLYRWIIDPNNRMALLKQDEDVLNIKMKDGTKDIEWGMKELLTSYIMNPNGVVFYKTPIPIDEFNESSMPLFCSMNLSHVICFNGSDKVSIERAIQTFKYE